MMHPYQQPQPPRRQGFSGLVVSFIAVLALGAGCLGGVAIGVAGQSPTADDTTSATTKAEPQAKAAPTAPQPVDTELPEPQASRATYVKLPDFTGQNAAVAKQWLVDQGWDEFRSIKLGSQDPYDTIVLLPENWTVTKQSHRAGRKVKVGTVIVLTCTKQ
jgi:hypothetical protein